MNYKFVTLWKELVHISNYYDIGEKPFCKYHDASL